MDYQKGDFVGRMAAVIEGNYINCYFLPGGEWKDAVLLGSLNAQLGEDQPEYRDRWILLMQELAKAMITAITGRETEMGPGHELDEPKGQA